MTIPLPSPPRRILIIKPSSLGDVVHSLPVLFLLRRQFPNAHIAWLVAPYCAGLLRGLKELDEVILFDRRFLGEAWYNPRAFLALCSFHRGLRRHNFDLAIDLQGLFRSGYFARVTGAALRVGLANARESAPVFYTHRVVVGTPEIHAVDRYLKIAAALGCPGEPIEFHFPVTDADRDYIHTLIPSPRPYAVFLPGANWPTKRWPAERFAELVSPLHRRFNLSAVVAGGDDAAGLAPLIPNTLDLTNRTTLPQLVALLERAALVIANDSGPMHIAAALGRPLVAIFGPTNSTRTGPYALPHAVVNSIAHCAPCYHRTCSHHRCLRKLHIAPVLRAVQRQLPTQRPLPA